MKLRVRAFALSFGIMVGVAIFLITYWFMIMNYEGSMLIKLRNLFPGYSVTWYGGLIGLIWGFVAGFLGGGFLAWLYNKFTDLFPGSSKA
jgi:hypothetical protein